MWRVCSVGKIQENRYELSQITSWQSYELLPNLRGRNAAFARHKFGTQQAVISFARRWEQRHEHVDRALPAILQAKLLVRSRADVGQRARMLITAALLAIAVIR